MTALCRRRHTFEDLPLGAGLGENAHQTVDEQEAVTPWLCNRLLAACRHTGTFEDLCAVLDELIQQQGWEPGLMPKSCQLQHAGQHGLVAAVRQMGGFKSIAADLGLAPCVPDKRGRRKKLAEAPQCRCSTVVTNHWLQAYSPCQVCLTVPPR